MSAAAQLEAVDVHRGGQLALADVLDPPDELTARRLLALLGGGGRDV
jgi:hypothetical protein